MEINILCFGDSLTDGYSAMGMVKSPYGKYMKRSLKKSWQSAKMQIDIDGRSGDLVSTPGNFLRRITDRCANTSKPFDWIIILGGTNDLGYGRSPETIFAALQKVYEVALDHGAKILAMTVPECYAKNERLDRRRDALNKSILENKSNRYYPFDLHAAIPYHSMPEAERDDIWDDGLHLTPDGYRRMGELIAAKLADLEAELQKTDVLEITGVEDASTSTAPTATAI